MFDFSSVSAIAQTLEQIHGDLTIEGFWSDASEIAIAPIQDGYAIDERSPLRLKRFMSPVDFLEQAIQYSGD